MIHKTPCNHGGGCIDPDECVLTFINKKNEEKVFVGTNDSELRNNLRNLGTVPIFFFKQEVLIMDTPSDAFNDKMKFKELLKLEPTKQEKKYILQNKEVIKKVQEEERIKEKMKDREKVKDLYCMGIKTKLAKGPNPLSMRKAGKRAPFPGEIAKKRRPRKGKRSKQLSLLKQETKSKILAEGE